MAKQPGTSRANQPPTGDVILADGEPLDLRNRYLAAFLSWLIPGCGHYYQQRKFKATIYFASIMSCLIVGLIVSGGRCVYASWNGVERRWQFALQAAGLPAIPAVVQAWRVRGGNEPLLQGWFFDRNEPGPFAAPVHVHQLDQWHKQTASGFELGTLYTMIAGLLNILAVYDAYAGPLPAPTSGRKKRLAEADASHPKSRTTSLERHLAMVVSMSWTYLLMYVPLLVASAAVIGATRHEKRDLIIGEIMGHAFRITAFMLGIYVVLQVVSWCV